MPRDVDNCPDDANGDQLDNDGDGIGDVCDEDAWETWVIQNEEVQKAIKEHELANAVKSDTGEVPSGVATSRNVLPKSMLSEVNLPTESELIASTQVPPVPDSLPAKIQSKYETPKTDTAPSNYNVSTILLAASGLVATVIIVVAVKKFRAS